MKLCPIADLNESPLAQKLVEFRKEVTRIAEDSRRASQSGETVEVAEVERHLVQLVNELGLLGIQVVLQALDPGTDDVEVEGQILHRVLYGPEAYQTRFGKVIVKRGRYRRGGRNTATVCPLEFRAGIIEGFWTPGAARLAAFLGGQLSLRASQQVAAEAGMKMTNGSLGRLLPALSDQWEASRENNQEELRGTLECPRESVLACVSVDGVLAPMREKTAERKAQREQPGKHGSGPSGYREVGCGTISFHDKEGERLATWYAARMPEAKKATLGQMLLQDMVHLTTQQPGLRRIYLADGADINWQIADAVEAACWEAACWEAAGREAAGREAAVSSCVSGDSEHTAPIQAAPLPSVQIVDYFHACEHLKRACDAAFGASTSAGQIEFVKLKAKLKEDDDGVGKVIDALRYRLNLCKEGSVAHKQIKAELTYFRNQRKRMHYADYQRQNLPIASGVVEAACKTLVTQRLKGSGMAWTPSGGQGVLNVRCWLQSGCFEKAWEILSKGYRQSCQAVDTSTKPILKLAA